MASTKPKFCFTTSGILVSSTAVFILLSVCVVEALECYWCGPLAEQVHRSQRAPSCDAALDQRTACDPGLTHCAVVATYPPYIESRYCVKLYQDECYLLYCNSTRTWRMSCPCRGDLCNGPNTDREIKAFATLTDLVYKSQSRTKRSVITASNFISGRRTRNKNSTEDILPANVNRTVNEEMQSDQGVNNISNDINDDNATMPDDEKVPSTVIAVPVSIDKQENISNNNEDNKIDYPTTTPNIVQEIKAEEDAEMVIQKNNMENEEFKTAKTEIQIINLTEDTFKEMKNEEKTEIYILNTTPSTNKMMRDEINIPNTTPRNIPDINNYKKKETSIKANKTETPAASQTTVKHNENLPTAEALQHTVSPVEKTTEATTVESKSTTVHALKINVTVKPTLPSKNNNAPIQKLAFLTQITFVLIQVFIQ